MAHDPKNNIYRCITTVAALALLFCVALGAKPSHALEKLRVFRGYLILEGQIEPGDYISLRNFLRNQSNFEKITGGVFLASPGGRLNEALKIGYLIRELRLTTNAPASPLPERRDLSGPPILATDLVNPRHYQCASACFIIYVAGVDRQLSRAGRLGIHRPRVQKKRDAAADDREGATDDEVSIVSAGVRNSLKLYLGRMNVPPRYLELMYSVPPDQVRWLTQEEFDQDLKGYISGVDDLLREKCAPSSDRSGCVRRIRAELSEEGWHKIFQQP